MFPEILKSGILKDMYAYWNNTLVQASDIRLSPSDLGMLRGFTIFDVMVVEHGRAFLWERHYDRLALSAQSIELVLPLDKEAYGKALAELIAHSSTEELVLRTVLSGGPSENGFSPEPGRETFYILTEERHRLPLSVYATGVKLITLPYERYLPQVKFANHAISLWDLERRKREDAFDTLYVADGMISEASQGNVLMVKDGVLVTPREEVLWGIVQGLVMELAEAAHIPTQWRSISLEELFEADEILLTGSSKGIVPVVSLDGRSIGNGKPGPVCATLSKAYTDFMRASTAENRGNNRE